MASIIVIELYRVRKTFDTLAHTFFPFFYTVLPFSLFPFAVYPASGLPFILNHNFEGSSPAVIIGFFLLLWINDSGAYLAGVSLGKHRLMERISPKKSWEGFIGGAVFTALGAWLLSDWLGAISIGSGLLLR